jgi:signal transduction histidine kinase/DNA-binding response OmpR family regulator/CHASE3 domain sensor protein
MKVKATFKRNLLIGFGLSLLLLIISSVASFFSIQNLLSSAYWVDHTNQVILKLESTVSFLKDAETGQRGFLLSGNDEFLQPYQGAYDSAMANIQEVKQLTVDNPPQQVSVEQLRISVMHRQQLLQQSIADKRAGRPVNMETLQSGRIMMDNARDIVKAMEGREKNLLQSRTESLNRISGYTPLLIIIAAILALLITCVFYIRVRRDFEERSRLQEALEEKDRDISRRIDIIKGIAEKVASGDYTIRVGAAQGDSLGVLATSLDRMTVSLESSFNLLADKEWLQSGVAGLNNRMVGEKDVNLLTGHIIDFLAEYTGSQVGALYVHTNKNILELSGSFAFNKAGARQIIPFGQGLAGQCAVSGKTLLLHEIPEDSVTISYAAGEIKPSAIITVPVFYEGVIKAVIELATVNGYGTNDVAFLEEVTHNVGLAINTAENRRRVQELLEETQAQSEELQMQHSELENINTELEAQAQKLQASEEELRVQQEELQQANQELEERSRLLEDRNQVIVERNLEIQKKAEELELSTKYKSEFLANMSHELRTPLNSILLLSRLMSENTEQNLNEDQIESAQVIQSSGKGLLNLIDEILDLSKIEAGKMDLELNMAAVHDICSGLESLFAPIAREKDLAFNVNILADAPALIETDRMRLEQILKNLLSNALKFTAKGAVTLQVGPAPGQPDHVRFAVRDTGIGIPADKQLVIFEAFQQADGSTRRKYGGTGLGLSISRELAKLLGGEIRLDSEPGHGSEFSIILPVHHVADAAEPAHVPATQQQAEQVWQDARKPLVPEQPSFTATEIPAEIPDDRDNITAADKLILIVEDDTKFASVLLDFTHKRGYKGIVAVRGDQGIEMAQRYMPRAILLDIVLPIQSGWQVMEALKSNPATRHIPVHIISSMEAKKESLQKGAVDFINKPLALDRMPQIFQQLEDALTRNPKKVLIVEENAKHAQALAYFLDNFNVTTEITGNISGSVQALGKEGVNCVILDMGVPDENAYETLETVKRNPGLENLPIIIFTGKNLSRAEENRIRQYADSIVIKTAHSYQRMLDEVALFLHLVEEKGGQKPERKTGPLKEVLRSKTVLIADDDVRNIFSLTKALEQHKMNIISALDGKEAMQQLANNPKIDIVLMDMMMPEMDGYETIRQIRQQSQYKHLPILAVTAKTMLGDREKCIRAGASDYISKPVDIDQLVSLLRVWLYDRS